MTKMNNKARRVARELKYTGVAIDTTDVQSRGRVDAQRDAQDATRLREMFDDWDVPIGLLEHELKKLKQYNHALYHVLKDEFGMEYL